MSKTFAASLLIAFMAFTASHAPGQEKDKAPAKAPEKPLTDEQKKELVETQRLNQQAVQFFHQGQFDKAIALA